MSWERPCYATLGTNNGDGLDDIHIYVCQLPAGHDQGGQEGAPSAHRDSEFLWTTSRVDAVPVRCALYDRPQDGVCTCGAAASSERS
jgi:hypothetical protein